MSIKRMTSAGYAKLDTVMTSGGMARLRLRPNSFWKSRSTALFSHLRPFKPQTNNTSSTTPIPYSPDKSDTLGFHIDLVHFTFSALALPCHHTRASRELSTGLLPSAPFQWYVYTHHIVYVTTRAHSLISATDTNSVSYTERTRPSDIPSINTPRIARVCHLDRSHDDGRGCIDAE